MQTEINKQPNFDAYFSGNLSPEDRHTLENQVRADASLKESFQAHYLAELATTQELAKMKTLIDAVRAASGPLPTPTLSLSQKIQLYLIKNPITTSLAASVVVIFIALQVLIPSYSELAPDYMIHPFNPEVAGGNTATSPVYLYFRNAKTAIPDLQLQSESCAHPPEFCVSLYYLAHAQLKTGDLRAASASFDQLQPMLPLAPPYAETSKISWNSWLCKAAQEGFDLPFHKESLKKFENATDKEVNQKANALKRTLSSPFRKIKI